MTSTTDALEQRIASLEQQMRHAHSLAGRYRLAALTLSLGLVGVVTVAASMGPDVPGVIQARRFEVVDDDGIVVVAASAGENGGTLSLWNGEHLNVAMLGANEHGGDLALWNTDGDNVLGAFATATGGELSIWNTEGGRGCTGRAPLPHLCAKSGNAVCIRQASPLPSGRILCRSISKAPEAQTVHTSRPNPAGEASRTAADRKPKRGK